jgi:hypothetical protein
MIREGWLESEPVNTLDAASERFFLRLCLRADDFGRYHANPMLLRSTLFPLRDDVKTSEIGKWLDACQRAGLLICYSIENKAYVEIRKFSQRMRAAISKFPQPPDSCQAHDGQMPDKCPSSVWPPRSEAETESEAESESKAESKTETDSAKLSLPFESPTFAESWANFRTHRKQIRKPLTPMAETMQLKQLAEIGEQRAIRAIEHTIAKGWQGIREPDGKSPNGTPQINLDIAADSVRSKHW